MPTSDVFLRAKTVAFAAQNQFHSGAVSFAEKAFLPNTQRKQKLFGFVKAECARSYAKFVTHLSNCKVRAVGQFLSLSLL